MQTVITSINRLKKILPSSSGRDSSGKISIRSRGGRHKRYFRLIDWRRDKRNIKAKVQSIEYDPNRSVNISLLKYEDGELRYILHPLGLKVGDEVEAGDNTPIKPGCAMPLKNIPIGVAIHNVELTPGKGGQIIRSAGSSGVIIGKEKLYAHVKLPSGEVRKVNINCFATIGQLDNENKKHQKLGKAGRKRYLGRRPKVRGTAQHPDSHPHGGGEGRSGEGMQPKTPWGKPARGKKTRKKNKASNKFIVQRRKKNSS